MPIDENQEKVNFRIRVKLDEPPKFGAWLSFYISPKETRLSYVYNLKTAQDMLVRFGQSEPLPESFEAIHNLEPFKGISRELFEMVI